MGELFLWVCDVEIGVCYGLSNAIGLESRSGVCVYIQGGISYWVSKEKKLSDDIFLSMFLYYSVFVFCCEVPLYDAFNLSNGLNSPLPALSKRRNAGTSCRGVFQNVNNREELYDDHSLISQSCETTTEAHFTKSSII